MRVPTKLVIAFAAMLALGSMAVAQDYNECTDAISSNFNGTAIEGGSYIWFTGALKLKGLPSGTTEVYVSHSTITFIANGTTYAVKVPDSTITLSPSTTLAATDFTLLSPHFLGDGWDTNLPSSGLAGNDLMTAVRFSVPSAGLPGGIKNVTWSATFSSFTSGLTVQWQWAAAVYSTFTNNYNSVGVKPVDDNQASEYKNSDHAGTPENFKQYVIGGATGGGGSNFTGSLSATASCALSPS